MSFLPGLVKLLFSASLLLLWTSATGCGAHKPTVNFDPRFSVNLLAPTANWPDIESMTVAEIEVYEKYGKPDYFRPLYSKRGDIVTRWEAGPYVRERKVTELKRSWVYDDRNLEIRFTSPTGFEEKPLSDKVRTLIERGDPSDISPLQSADMAREAWTYWDIGEKYFFTEEGNYARPKQTIKGVGKHYPRKL